MQMKMSTWLGQLSAVAIFDGDVPHRYSLTANLGKVPPDKLRVNNRVSIPEVQYVFLHLPDRRGQGGAGRRIR